MKGCYSIIWDLFLDIIHGKLDQKNSQLEVDYAIGRDIRPADVGIIISTLQEWCDSCEAVLSCVETQIHRANAEKNRKNKHKEAIELEVRGQPSLFLFNLTFIVVFSSKVYRVFYNLS